MQYLSLTLPNLSNRRFISKTGNQQSGHTKLVVDIVEELKLEQGALLPILHAIQDELGYVPTESVPFIADSLNLSRA